MTIRTETLLVQQEKVNDEENDNDDDYDNKNADDAV
jgi:hypothetical protein